MGGGRRDALVRRKLTSQILEGRLRSIAKRCDSVAARAARCSWHSPDRDNWLQREVDGGGWAHDPSEGGLVNHIAIDKLGHRHGVLADLSWRAGDNRR